MSLSVGLDVALSGLSTTAEQTAVVSRNVARSNDPYATRKTANVITTGNGGIRVSSVTRATNSALLEKMLSATSVAAGQKAVVDALNTLNETVGDPEVDTSPAAMTQKLSDAIQQYAAAPQDPIRAQSAVAAAQNLAVALNDATRTVQDVRAQADAGMADSVKSLNTLLARLETANTEIVKGTRKGVDVTDLLDQRDGILASISEEVGIRTVDRENGDIAVYTDSGVTLFDVSARSVTFNRTMIYAPGATGNAVYVDGVPIAGGAGVMLASSGRLTGMASIRDNASVTYQNQLDEIARGLIEAFAESDQSGSGLPDVPGLFTYPGAPAMPTSGTLIVGLAASIGVNANVDPAQGGNLSLLRDGAISGNPAYTYNTTGGSAFADRLNEYVTAMSEARPFDSVAQLATGATLINFSSSSSGWLSEARKTANSNADYANALLERSSEALSKETGINIDEEMTSLLELERAYQASTRLITTIDNMMKTLLAAAG